MGFEVCSFWVLGFVSGFKVGGSTFEVRGLGYFRVYYLGFWVWVSGSGYFRFYGLGVKSLGFMVYGFRFLGV